MPKKRKAPIPKALREQVWATYIGNTFEGKCMVTWCKNRITVFDFQSGHNIPEAKGGPTTLENLRPICSRCNTSMGSQYTFDQWCTTFSKIQVNRTWAEFLSQCTCACACIFPPVNRNNVITQTTDTETATQANRRREKNKKTVPVEQVCAESVSRYETKEQRR
jgi:hypothetical protein